MKVTCHCPNCGTKNEIAIKNDVGYKECIECKTLLRYSKWKTGKAQVIGELSKV